MKVAGMLLHCAAAARYIIADKGHDANASRKSLGQDRMVPVIPGRSSRKRKIVYDKLARDFLSAVTIAILVAFWL